MLDQNNPIPLYHQLKAYIRAQISQGLWKPGDRIPSESEIGQEFKISRTTVRQAIGELTNEGVLNRKHGVGTFVAWPQIEKRATKLTGFTQDMRSRGLKPSSVVLQKQVIPAPADVANWLGIPESESVILLKRLRLADDEPMGIDIVYYPAEKYRGLLDEDLINESLYKLLAEKYDTHPTRSELQLSAVECSVEDARDLGIRRGSPLLQLIRTTFDQNNAPFEQVYAVLRGDRYIFYVEQFA
jgi:DNA-binding GntR family transcriptional regulator